MVTLTFVRHASSSGKNQRRKRAPFYLKNSRRVKTLFIILMKLVNLLRGEVLLWVCVRVANPNIKERRLFSRPEAPRTDIQPRVMGLVDAPRQHFPRNFLENRLHLDVGTHRLQNFSLEISNFVVPLYDISSTQTNQSMVSVKQVPASAHQWDVIE